MKLQNFENENYVILLIVVECMYSSVKSERKAMYKTNISVLSWKMSLS
jgi:hypothetical protein